MKRRLRGRGGSPRLGPVPAGGLDQATEKPVPSTAVGTPMPLSTGWAPREAERAGRAPRDHQLTQPAVVSRVLKLEGWKNPNLSQRLAGIFVNTRGHARTSNRRGAVVRRDSRPTSGLGPIRRKEVNIPGEKPTSTRNAGKGSVQDLHAPQGPLLSLTRSLEENRGTPDKMSVVRESLP